MTTLRRLKYVKAYIDRTGQPRRYFRRRGQPSIALPGLLGSAEFMAAYSKALGGAPIVAGQERTTAGSVAAMAVGYFASSAFSGLSVVSQRQYRKRIEQIRRDFGHLPIAGLTRARIIKMLDTKRSTPAGALDFLRALRLLIRHAVNVSVLDTDPSIGIKVAMPKSSGFKTWSEDDIAAFRAVHPLGSKARLAMELLLNSALRVGDAVRLGRAHIRNGALSIATRKTGATVTIPVTAELQSALDAAPSSEMVFLLNERGRPFTAEQFSKWFSQQAQQAGLDLSAHGLRKAAARRLAEAGATAHEIAAITGHASLREVERYTRAADKAKLAAAAMNKVRMIKA